MATKQETSKLQFRYLPGFAEYLKEHKLEDFVRVQLRYSREVNLPLLRFVEKLGEEQIVQVSIVSTTEFLDSIIHGRVREYIEESNRKWLANQLELFDKYDVMAEDISLVSFIRKKAMQAFLPEYTAILADALAIIGEIDQLNAESDVHATTTYTRILKDKLSEHSHFIERITETSPGIIYVYDLLDDKEVYANKMMTQLLGYSPEDWKKLDADFVGALIHPEDIPVIENNQKAFATAADGEIRSIRYRIKDKGGDYRWMRTYESIFKRTEDGRPWQVIGIALDITTEKRTSDQLHRRENELLEAQALTKMGSFVWNTTTDSREATPQFYEILGLINGISLESFLDNVHAADKQRVRQAFGNTLENNAPLDIEFRYEYNGAEKIVWFKAGSTINAQNEQVIQGIVMDITERHYMIQKLQRSEDINKKAQALTHIGNWTWDLARNKLEWSDELYRIYGLEPGSPIPAELVFGFNHPDDAERVSETINKARAAGKPYDLYYRIVQEDGTVKTLHALAEPLLDEKGEAYKIIGTLQDVTEREILIERLQRSDALYKQAQSIAHLGNWIYEISTGKFYWTDELFRIYGIAPQSEALDWNKFMEFIVEEDKELVNAFVTEAIRAGQPFDIYHRCKRKNDGAIRTIHVRGEGLVDDEGKVYQLFGTSQDVTEQQRIEQELRENQNFIKKIADATPSIIASYNINTGAYRFVSQGIKSLLGYEPQEVIDKGIEFFTGIIHPDDLPSIIEKNRQALENANLPENEDQDLIVDFQYRMRRADGEYRWMHTFGTVFDRNAQGKVEHVLNISIDISDRIKAEETVAEQQRFISHIAEASPTILYLFDLEQKKFIYLNKEVTEVLGYTPEEILSLGSQVYMYLHPEDAPKSEGNYAKYKHEGGVTMHQMEARIRSRAGEWKWLLTREIVFKRDENGKAIQVLGSALDITDRKEMEHSLSKKNVELEQSNANLEEFAYVASHDLQEPLRKIAIFGDRLLLNYKEGLDEDGQTFLQKIVDSSRRMQGMINDLLSVSLLSGDKSFARYNLKSVLNDVLQTLEFKIEAKQATVIADDLPEANIIPSQMRQLFQNLISNSLKFVSPDRKPVINIRHAIATAEELQQHNLASGKPHLKITVSDNGIGFDNEYAPKIFIIFQRLHGKFEYEGTGIGLAICKKIVENHEGVIFAEGAPGVGATFTIIIPF